MGARAEDPEPGIQGLSLRPGSATCWLCDSRTATVLLALVSSLVNGGQSTDIYRKDYSVRPY